MKRSLLILTLAALCGAGCDYGTGSEEEAPKKASSTTPSSSRTTPSSGQGLATLPGSAQQLNALAVGPAADSPGGEALAQLGRADFDGDGRVLDALNAGGSAPAVYAASYSGTRSRAYSLSAPKRIKVAGSDVPAPAVPDDGSGSSRKPNAVLAAFESFQKSAYEAVYPILSRLDWGARSARTSTEDQTPYRITVHHTDGPIPTDRAESIQQLRNIQHYHQNGHGWADIGYHFVIDGSGRVFEGRPVGLLGAHAESANAGNIGIALMGNFEKTRPTPQQVESLTRLSSFLAARYNIDPARRFDGHRHFGDTDCPGRYLVEILAALRMEIGERKLAMREEGGRVAQADFRPVLVTDTAS